MKLKFLCFTFLIYLATVAIAQQTPAPLPASKNSFIVIAHRGNHVRVPENTIESIEEAIKCGADYIETDLRTTKDGYLVILHDASVDRITNGKGYVKDLTLKEIQQLTINKTYHIPEFKDVLNACNHRINIYLDFKDADVTETYRQIKNAAMEKNIVVYLNAPSQYEKWKRIAPSMPLMGSLPENIHSENEFDKFINKTQLAVLDNVNDSYMASVARNRGVSIWLDVQGKNEGPSIWKKALQKNVQGFQTDNPEALINYLKSNGIRN